MSIHMLSEASSAKVGLHRRVGSHSLAPGAIVWVLGFAGIHIAAGAVVVAPC